jgi:hypothetical protein
MMSLYPSRAGISCHQHIHPVFYIDLLKKQGGVMFERQSMLSKIDDNDNDDRATEVA